VAKLIQLLKGFDPFGSRCNADADALGKVGESSLEMVPAKQRLDARNGLLSQI
jgi:hypothetical protein